MFKRAQFTTLACLSMLLAPTPPASAAVIRADFTAVFDSGTYTNNPEIDSNCDLFHTCNWTNLVGQEAHGHFIWDTENTDFGASKYPLYLSLIIPIISSMPIPVYYNEGGHITAGAWRVGSTTGNATPYMMASIDLRPGASIDGSATPDLSLSTQNSVNFVVGSVVDTLDQGYHCPIEDPTPYPEKLPGQRLWGRCSGTGHLTSLNVYRLPEPDGAGLALLGFASLAAVSSRARRLRRSNSIAAKKRDSSLLASAPHRKFCEEVDNRPTFVSGAASDPKRHLDDHKRGDSMFDLSLNRGRGV